MDGDSGVCWARGGTRCVAGQPSLPPIMPTPPLRTMPFSAAPTALNGPEAQNGAAGGVTVARRRTPTVLAISALALWSLAGCSSPLYESSDEALRRTILNTTHRELREAQQVGTALITERPPRVESLGIKGETLTELERISGPESYSVADVARMSASMMGQPQAVVRVNMQRVVMTSVENNLTVQFARIAPAIAQASVVAAEAAFDWTLFSNTQWSALDRQSVGSLAVSQQQSQDINTTVGLRRRMTSGGAFTVQQAVGYTYNTVENNINTPNPSSNTELALQIDQPLLRNFGSDVSLAEVRLAQNSERDQIQTLKANLIRTATDAETAYWQLVSSYQTLRISQRLLDRGLSVRDTLRARMNSAGDVRQAQFSDAVAQVAAREADVSRAENQLRKASDALKTTMNDPQLPVGSDVVLLPADMPVDQAIRYSVADSMVLALQNRPEVQRAILGIDDASVRQLVSDNQRLPQVDLRAQTRFSGLRDNTLRSFEQMTSGGFVDFIVGLVYEQPIGNRAAEAQFRQRRLERSQSVIAYRDVIQRVMADVVNAVRDVTTNYVLIEQTRAARVAAAENLRALEVEEKTIQGLTPEFLDLKLRRQQALSIAEIQEINALTEYNTGIARLHSACGTSLERNRIKFTVPSDVPAEGAGMPVMPAGADFGRPLPGSTSK